MKSQLYLTLTEQIRLLWPVVVIALTFLATIGITYLATKLTCDRRWLSYMRMYSAETNAELVSKLRARADAAELALKEARQTADNVRALCKGATQLSRKVTEILEIAK